MAGKTGTSGKKIALLALKLLVTAALLAWIIDRIEWSEFLATLAGASPWIIGAVVVMRLNGIALSAFKWQRLMAVHGVWFGFGRLLRWYLVASFLNNFLPSSIGGDSYRIYKTWRNERGRGAAVLAVLLERVSGVAALGLLGYVAAIVISARGDSVVATTVVRLGTIAIVVAALVVLIVPRVPRARWITQSKSWRYVDGLIALARDFWRSPRQVVLIVAISFVFHLNKVGAIWLLMHTLGARVGPFEIMVGVLAAEIGGLIPVSLGGLGVMEASFILVMGSFGVPDPVSLATMLLLRVLMIPVFAVGGVLYSLGGDEESPPSETPEPP
jgi:uncharacterized protein (TIRG00374 family)